MDREECYLTTVGMVAVGRGLSLHRLNVMYRDPRFGTYATRCGRWLKSLSDMKVDYLEPTRVCQQCFGRTGAAFYIRSDRFVVVQFFDQMVLDAVLDV